MNGITGERLLYLLNNGSLVVAMNLIAVVFLIAWVDVVALMAFCGDVLGVSVHQVRMKI